MESDPSACDGGGCAEGFDGSAVSRAEAAEVFELVEASLDTVALAVVHLVLLALYQPVAAGRDDHGGSHGADGQGR